MRLMSATEAKAGHKYPNAQQIPRRGTILRAQYDRLMENRGLPVFMSSEFTCTRKIQLVDYYGLDIRQLPGRRRYVLAGEWFGSVYVDYIAAQINGYELG